MNNEKTIPEVDKGSLIRQRWMRNNTGNPRRSDSNRIRVNPYSFFRTTSKKVCWTTSVSFNDMDFY